MIKLDKLIQLFLVISILIPIAKCTYNFGDHKSMDESSLQVSTLRLDFNPAYIEGLRMNSNINVTVVSNRTLRLRVDVYDKSIAEVFDVLENDRGLQFKVKGTFLGRTHIDVRYFNELTQTWEPHSHYKVGDTNYNTTMEA